MYNYAARDKKSCAEAYIDSTGSVWSIYRGMFSNSNANVLKETEVYADKWEYNYQPCVNRGVFSAGQLCVYV